MSRATKAYVSAYDRSRVHQSSLYRFEQRRLVANFGALLGNDRLIRCATWSIDRPEIGVMSDPQISDDARETSVMFATQLSGWATVRCQITLDSGEQYPQVFRVNVRQASWFVDDAPLSNGPFSLRVCREDPPPPPPVPEQLVFIAGLGVENVLGYTTELDGGVGTLVSSNLEGLTLIDLWHLAGGSTLRLKLQGEDGTPPEDVFSTMQIYSGDQFEEGDLIVELAFGSNTDEGDNMRQWTWSSQVAGDPFEGGEGQTFGVRFL